MKLVSIIIIISTLLFVGCSEQEISITTLESVEEPSPTSTLEITPTTEPTASPSEEFSPTPIDATTPLPTLEATATQLRPTTTPTTAPVTAISLQQVVSGLDRPTFITHAGDDRLFIVEQPGRVLIVKDGAVVADPFLDIRDRVGSGSLEQGLFSIAFDPYFNENAIFYVNYTDLRGDTVVSRFNVSQEDPNLANPDSEIILLQIDQPYDNHNGGQLQFGPDGLLYVGLGDGGSRADPQNNGQDATTLLGAILRLDVSGKTVYEIPATNPFVNTPNLKPEIWAFGLRNPWRFSFDRLTGDLYITDVGQNLWEEVNFQPAQSAGGENYGWNVLEGNHCFLADPCDSTGMVFPIAEYQHIEGNCSVTGGYVYRGQKFPNFTGNYFFGDYCSGKIWAMYQQIDGAWNQTQLLDTELYISSFGEDVAGELYVLDMVSGAVFRLVEP